MRLSSPLINAGQSTTTPSTSTEPDLGATPNRIFVEAARTISSGNEHYKAAEISDD